MLFARPIINTLAPYDADLAAQCATEFSPCGKDIANFLGAVASISPYLRHLMALQRDWLIERYDTPLDQALRDAMMGDGDPVQIGLRRAKQRVALVLGLVDLAGSADLYTVTQALSDFADKAIDLALRDAIARADLPDDVIGASGFGGIFCLAMGKLGARELNYSSDIDLIFFFDDQAYPPAQVGDLRAQFSKIIRRTCQILSAQTEDGYVFRTDLRLRPNPSVTPVCQSVSSAHHYYHTEGRSWERAAFIKARVCAGDLKAGQRFLDKQAPFVWRTALDFAAMKEVAALLDQARDHRGVHENDADFRGYDLKLGRGGIREIEFFTQTRQLIFGGRNPNLRQRDTCAALQALTDVGQIRADHAQALIAHYTYLRNLEHRVQMLRDQQTHSLPRHDDDYMRFLHLCGPHNRNDFEVDLAQQINRTRVLTKPKAVTQTAQQNPTKDVVDFSAFDDLPALRHDRAKVLFEQLKPTLSTLLTDSQNKTQALQSLRQYIGALREGVAPLSLLHERPDVLNDLFHLMCLSQPLAVELAQRMPQIYGLVEHGALSQVPTIARYQAHLRDRLSGQTDYETQLISMRAWAAEQKFQIKFAQLRRDLPIHLAQRAYSNIAQTCLGQVVRVLQKELRAKYGRLAGAQLAIIAMGKLGSREMTSTSDLDLIVIYDSDQNARASLKDLDAKQYFTQFTRALITALSAPMAHGPLYEVDMRLRPSGRAGTVATQIDSFTQYQREQAWVWEHQALCRARVITGHAQLRQKIEQVRAEFLNHFHTPKTLQQEARAMRDRLAADYIGKQPALSVKKGLGGMLDVDLLAQNYALMGVSNARSPMAQLADAQKAGLIPPTTYAQITTHYKRLKLVDFYLREMGITARDGEALSQASQALLTQRSGLDFDALLVQLKAGRAALSKSVTQCVNGFTR